MEISTIKEISTLKKQDVKPLCSIWIVHEKQDDNTFDVNVWDEIKNHREEGLERSRFPKIEQAENALAAIIEENPTITFVRLQNQIN